MPVVHADGRLEDPESELELEVSRNCLVLCTGLSTASETTSSEIMCRCIGWMKGRTGALLAVKGRRRVCTLRQQLGAAALAVGGWGRDGLQRTARPATNRGLDCCNWTDCFDKAAYKPATWWVD